MNSKNILLLGAVLVLIGCGKSGNGGSAKGPQQQRDGISAVELKLNELIKVEEEVLECDFTGGKKEFVLPSSQDLLIRIENYLISFQGHAANLAQLKKLNALEAVKLYSCLTQQLKQKVIKPGGRE